MIVTRLSGAPFITLSKARMVAADLDLDVNFQADRTGKMCRGRRRTGVAPGGATRSGHASSCRE